MIKFIFVKMKKNLKLVITIFIIGWCSVEAQDSSFVYSTDLKNVIIKYTTEQIPEIKKDNTLVYVGIGLVLLDIAIKRYYYRNQYFSN